MTDLRSRISLIEPFASKAFKEPDALFQPVYSWVWNAPVDEAGIDARLEEMNENGIRGMYIIPEPREFRPASMRTDMKPEYLTDEFFRLVRYACEKAHSLGMTVWLYDEGGWPSGSACTKVNALRPESCRKTIAGRTLHLRAGEAYTPSADAISAYRLKQSGDGLPGGETHIEVAYTQAGACFESETEILEYYAKALGGYPGDPLDKEGVQLFMRLTHDGYFKSMGDLFARSDGAGGFMPGSARVQLMFTDEPGAGRYPWPNGFAEAFEARWGYSIAPYIHALVNDGEEASSAAVGARIDYRRLCGEMFLNHYFKPIQDWCAEKGILSGGHLDMDHISDGTLYHNYGAVLPLLRALDVPGVDVIWRQIDMPRENEPACAEGNGFFPRFASSAAAQVGKKYALSESFAIYGQGTTGNEMRYVINFQLVRGINLFNFMSSSYGKTGAYAMVARPSMVSEMPEFSHYRGLNDYTARASYLMQLGRPKARNALFFPARDIWAGGERRKKALYAFDGAGRVLEALHALYDVIDEEGLLACARDGNALCLGLARYESVIVPEGALLTKEVAQALQGVKREAVYESVCSGTSVRVEARDLGAQGELYMLFNESGARVNDCFRCAAAHVYRLYPEDGRIERASGEWRFSLGEGEAAFFLAGPQEVDGAVCRMYSYDGDEEAAELGEYTLKPLSRLRLDRDGVHRELLSERPFTAALGSSWPGLFGSDFSGEVEYSTPVRLPRALEVGEKLEILFGWVVSFASVYVDGAYVGEVYTPHACLYADGALLGGKTEFTLTLRVANTGANAFKHFSMAETFDPRDIGQYDEKVRTFEAHAPGGGLYDEVEIYIREFRSVK